MHPQPQIPNQTSPPIDLSLWHRFLRTQGLLWLSREAGESLIVLVETVAEPEPRGLGHEEVLALAVRDLYQCFIDLEFLDHDEARFWGPVGMGAFQTRPGLREMVERLQRVAPVDLSHEVTIDPIRTLFGLWIDPDRLTALGRIGTAVAIHPQESSEEPSMIDDPLYLTLAGLICDLPFIAAVLRQVGGEPPRLRALMVEIADHLEKEAQRLESLLANLV